MVNFKNGRGLDIGTGFLVMSQMDEEGNLHTKSIRDSFLEIIPINKIVLTTMKKGLIRSGVSFFEEGNKIIILGQDSLNQSVERQVTLRRPMQKGVISPSEINVLPIFKALLKELLGPPSIKDEKVMFTVPAAPLDGYFDVIYHSAAMQSILADLGYAGTPINEGHALAFAELSDENYTGISISLGSGMSNIAVTNVAELVCKFSIARGGDFIDEFTALALGFNPNAYINTITPSLVTLVKEQGVDILNPDTTDRIKLGISAHYKVLIKYIVDNLVNEISTNKSIPRFLQPVTIVLAGGTSLATGVVELFKEELDLQKDKLPFIIKEIRHIKGKALTAVAEGCLLASLSED